MEWRRRSDNRGREWATTNDTALSRAETTVIYYVEILQLTRGWIEMIALRTPGRGESVATGIRNQ